MCVRVLREVLLYAVLMSLLCGCKSEHLVYQSDLEDTWYAVNSALRHSTGSSARDIDEEKHVLRTWEYSCGQDYDAPYSKGGVFNRKDYQCRRSYWYAEIRCKAMDTGTEVIVSLRERAEYYPAKTDEDRDDYGRGTCLKAVQWRDKFFRKLNEKLGEPEKAKKPL